MSSFSQGVEKPNYIIHPYKFNLWLFMLSLMMVFGGLTSAYLVAKGRIANPIVFDLPTILWNNTLVIAFSSITVQFSVWAMKRGERNRALLGMLLTLVLGIVFLAGQFYAWDLLEMRNLGFAEQIDSEGNIHQDSSVSFFYVFTGLHGCHIVGGVVVVLYTLIRSWLNKFKESGEVLTYELVATFWHFLGLLWIYLFIFLLYTQN